ncbi:unnamed protein product [Camellia sinensis]
MIESQNSTSKCYFGILRRLLCIDSLPTHPSDLITDSTTTIPITTTFENPKKNFKIQVKTPGVVARLMGLVRTSLSFREVPTFLQQQCFDKVGGNGGNKMGLSSDMGSKDLKQKVTKTERNRENLRERKFENKRKVFRRKEDQPNRVCGNCSSKVDNVNLDSKNKVVVVQRQPRESLRAKKSGVKNVN